MGYYYMGLIGCVVVGVIASLSDCTVAATTHVVGGDSGWTIPPSGGSQFYINWSASKTFVPGDTLSFNFRSEFHDVAQVTKADYEACTYTNPIGAIIKTSPANVLLNYTGEHYYICTFQGHCAAGQKLAINVLSSDDDDDNVAPSPLPTLTNSPSPVPPTTSTELPCAPTVLTSPNSLPPMESMGPSAPPSKVLPDSSASSLTTSVGVMGLIMAFTFIFL